MESIDIVEALGVISVVASLVGSYLNAKQNWQGFVVWTASNVCWVIYDLYKACYSQAFLFFVYILMNLYGIYCWKFKKTDGKEEGKQE